MAFIFILLLMMYLCFYMKSDTIAHGLIHRQLEYQKEKGERMGQKTYILDELLAENFPKFMTGTKPQIQEAPKHQAENK